MMKGENRASYLDSGKRRAAPVVISDSERMRGTALQKRPRVVQQLEGNSASVGNCCHDLEVLNPIDGTRSGNSER